MLGQQLVDQYEEIGCAVSSRPTRRGDGLAIVRQSRARDGGAVVEREDRSRDSQVAESTDDAGINFRTVPAVTELTPMLRHYLELKARHPDGFLFYRMGDFFELFFEDAVRAAGLLGLTLTARQKGTDSEAPMCGVPHHAVEGYARRLLRAGHKVVLCDQVEDPAQAKGLVRREVTRILTPGTLSEPGLLEQREEAFLAALLWEEKVGAPGPIGGSGAAAFLDVSTGTFFVRRFADESEAVTELEALRPKELLCDLASLPPGLAGWVGRQELCQTAYGSRLESSNAAAERLRRRLGLGTLRGLGLVEGEPAVRAAAVALAYAEENQLSELSHVRDLAVRELGDQMVVDGTTLANLEVFRNARDGGGSGTLVELLDRTVTAAGARLLRDWLRRPLLSAAGIAVRQDAVAALMAEPARRTAARQELKRIGDFERLAGRAVVGGLSPREAAVLRDSLTAVPTLFHAIADLPSELLADAASTDPLLSLARRLAEQLVPSPPAQLDEGGAIAAGVDRELDEVRSLVHDSKRHVVALELRERERTGIAALKIRYNRVFGYSIEISRASAARAEPLPTEYRRKQTLINAERYVTDEIETLAERILEAEGRERELERRLFAELRSAVAVEAAGLARLARAIATLDLVVGWAELALASRYVRPNIEAAGSGIRIVEGRHPVVERALGERFVPNDCELDAETQTIVVLTGPNMGGKSTYLRQVALVTLMAQTGCFVPAASATIGLVDRIFSRVGASDDLARGESTFMVEMIETANILRFATPRSLVILDEVGRGTSTFDGLSLAWSIVESLHERVGAMTLFATHYHELTELAELLPRVVNRTMAVREWEEKIVFLRRVVPGAADKSYGLHVARLAGIPEAVIARAQEVLGNLEAKEFDPEGRPRNARGAGLAARPSQLPLFTPPEEIVAKLLREVDLDRLTPLAALNLIASLQDRLK